MRQAKDLAQRSGHTLDDALQAVSDTEAGRQLKELANGAHRHEQASEWQAGVFWGSGIRPSAWQENSQKFACRILHNTAPIGPESPYGPIPKR